MLLVIFGRLALMGCECCSCGHCAVDSRRVPVQKPQHQNPIGARTTKLPSDVGVLAFAYWCLTEARPLLNRVSPMSSSLKPFQSELFSLSD